MGLGDEKQTDATIFTSARTEDERQMGVGLQPAHETICNSLYGRSMNSHHGG
jgi:hypothetical protein